MVLRMMKHKDSEEKQKHYQQSIALANKAVTCDLTDGESWYVLGNAHLTNFFVNECGSMKELDVALKAYA